MVIVIANTGHFEFIGLGHTTEEANAALLKRWLGHCQSNANAEYGYMQQLINDGSVQTVEVAPGQAVRYGAE